MSDKKPGPAPIYGAKMTMRRCNVDSETHAKAVALGQGNFSLGVRIAVNQAKAPAPVSPASETP